MSFINKVAAFLFISINLYCQTGDFYIQGFIYDRVTGETLAGTNILIYSDSLLTQSKYFTGVTTNSFGYYKISKIKINKYYLVFRYIGYKTSIKIVDLTAVKTNINLNVELEPENIGLSEVVVEGKKIDKAAVSTIDLPPDLINNLPTFSGEIDLFRNLQLLPGINKASEISNGLYVRGGAPDQTLTLVDGAIVYNPAHLGNIASTFNSNAIRDIKIIKGSFPAEYGGRLSSVLDIKLRNGTREREKSNLNIGSLTSSFSVEGPIKTMATYMIAGRWMYYDILQNNFNTNQNVPRYKFYDLNGKINYNLTESSSLSINAIYSKDKMYNSNDSDTEYEIEWENLNLGLNWVQISKSSLFLNSSLSIINYDFSSKIGISSNSTSVSSYYSHPNLTDITIRQNAELNWEINHKLKTGFEISFHRFNLVYNDYYLPALETDDEAGNKFNSIEAAVYFQNEFNFNDWINGNLGGRLYYFGSRKYFNFEPRLSVSIMPAKDFYIKTAVALVNQFIHLITRNDIALTSDLWYPSTNNIKPSSSLQFNFGIDKYFNTDEYQLSTECYYRNMKKLYEFVESPVLNPFDNSIEKQFTEGIGEAYGAEIFLQKRKGDLRGWIGYTLSWTKRKFDYLNFGKVFYPKYDRRNDLSIALTYDIQDGLTLGATFVYATGLRYTLPQGQFIFDHIGTGNGSEILLEYSETNKYKLPDYHKLDLSANYTFKTDTKIFTFYVSLYNVYNRKNPFAKYIVFSNNADNKIVASIKQLTLFPFIPTFGVNINF